MKFRVSMKDPDTLRDAIVEAVDEKIDRQFSDIPDLAPDDLDGVRERSVELVDDLCGKWFRYGEYLEVEIDTDAKTCTVVEVGA